MPCPAQATKSTFLRKLIRLRYGKRNRLSGRSAVLVCGAGRSRRRLRTLIGGPIGVRCGELATRAAPSVRRRKDRLCPARTCAAAGSPSSLIKSRKHGVAVQEHDARLLRITDDTEGVRHTRAHDTQWLSSSTTSTSPAAAASPLGIGGCTSHRQGNVHMQRRREERPRQGHLRASTIFMAGAQRARPDDEEVEEPTMPGLASYPRDCNGLLHSWKGLLLYIGWHNKVGKPVSTSSCPALETIQVFFTN